jgi:hypothetical protein
MTTLPPSCADCLEIWERQTPGTLRACPGLQWDYLTFAFTRRKHGHLIRVARTGSKYKSESSQLAVSEIPVYTEYQVV